MKKFTTLSGIAALCALASCGSPSDISLRNANYFGFQVNDGTLSGSYNGAGYTSTLVQNQVKGACTSRQLSSYGETPLESGLTGFTATCSGAAIFSRGFVEVEKTPQGNFMFEASGS
jgi:hypothetical protein